MLIFDKEPKVFPAAGHRDPGGTFFAIPPGPSLFFARSPHLPVPRWSLGSIWPNLFSNTRFSSLGVMECGVRISQQQRRRERYRLQERLSCRFAR